MASEDNEEVISNLVKIYDTKYKPQVARVFDLVPLEEGEANYQHAIRVAALTRTNLVLSGAMDMINCYGGQFIRAFSQAYMRGSCPAYFEKSGLARALNVFVLLFPYCTIKWARIKKLPVATSWEEVFERRCQDKDAVEEFWMQVLLPASNVSTDPFNTADITALLLAWSSVPKVPRD
jgi:hypothetical protein